MAADVFVATPSTSDDVEGELNQMLERTDVPFFLPAQPSDLLDPQGLKALAEGLSRAPDRVVGATGVTDQVRRDGSLRRVPALGVPDSDRLRALRRVPTPVLFRTAALREAGGWRSGEADWARRPHRHRPLLARLLARGGLIAVNAYLGVIDRPSPATAPDSILQALRALLLQRVTLTGDGFRASGRVAALSADLVTLAAPDGQVVLIPTRRVVSVTGTQPQPPGVPSPAKPLDGDLLELHRQTLAEQGRSAGRQVTRVWTRKRPGWP